MSTTPQQHKQQLIVQIQNLKKAISAEKSAVDQLMILLRTKFNARWPNITIDTRK